MTIHTDLILYANCLFWKQIFLLRKITYHTLFSGKNKKNIFQNVAC